VLVKNGDVNALPLSKLLEAEDAALRGKSESEASQAYKSVIGVATRSVFRSVSAILRERHGEWLLRNGDRYTARGSLGQAWIQIGWIAVMGGDNVDVLDELQYCIDIEHCIYSVTCIAYSAQYTDDGMNKSVLAIHMIIWIGSIIKVDSE